MSEQVHPGAKEFGINYFFEMLGQFVTVIKNNDDEVRGRVSKPGAYSVTVGGSRVFYKDIDTVSRS